MQKVQKKMKDYTRGKKRMYALLRDETNGYTRRYYFWEDEKEKTEEELEGTWFLWHEGNFSCDCNRSYFLYRRWDVYRCDTENVAFEGVFYEDGTIFIEGEFEE